MLALEGLKVLDMSNLVPGALCTMILGDMGADVIKVEPVKPFPLDDVGFSPGGEERRRDAAFFALNRNKKSIALNLRAEQGQEIFQKLARNADVIVEGYRPGVVERLGVDYTTISELNPRVIYCSMSGYGQDGPYKLMPGHDINYISMAGILGLIGPPDGAPCVPLNLVADFAGVSLYGALGILLAYIAREKTGKGQYIDQAYLDGSIHLMTWFTHRFFQEGSVIKKGESWALGTYPYYGVFETKDGKYLSIGCLEPHFWKNLCTVLGKEEFIAEVWSMETTFEKPDPKHDEMRAFLKATFLTKTRDEWFDLLSRNDIPAGKLYSMDEVFEDPQVVHRKMVEEIDDPVCGKVKQVGVMPKLSDTPGSIRRLAPIHGEHTAEILHRYGYAEEQVGVFKKDGVVA